MVIADVVIEPRYDGYGSTERRVVECMVLRIDEISALVRSLHGAPFTLVGAKYPYSRMQTDEELVNIGRVSNLREDELPLPEYDAAEVDSLFADWIDGEAADWSEYQQQNFHARG